MGQESTQTKGNVPKNRDFNRGQGQFKSHSHKNDTQNGILPFIPHKIIKSLLKDSSIKGITLVSFGTALFYYGT